MVIKGAYLIPKAATRILSPQHLAQQADDHFPREVDTGALTTSKNITLFWSQWALRQSRLIHGPTWDLPRPLLELDPTVPFEPPSMQMKLTRPTYS